jgi:hypothetical protein
MVPLTGCSWVFVEAPPPQHERMNYFDCTSGRGAPILDTIFAAGNAVSAIALAAAGGDSSTQSGLMPANQNGARYAAIAIDGVAALVFLLSAQSGFDHTKECREAKLELANRSLRPNEPALPTAAPVAAPPPPKVDIEAEVGKPCQAVPGMPGAFKCLGGLVCREGHCEKDATPTAGQ